MPTSYREAVDVLVEAALSGVSDMALEDAGAVVVHGLEALTAGEPTNSSTVANGRDAAKWLRDEWTSGRWVDESEPPERRLALVALEAQRLSSKRLSRLPVRYREAVRVLVEAALSGATNPMLPRAGRDLVQGLQAIANNEPADSPAVALGGDAADWLRRQPFRETAEEVRPSRSRSGDESSQLRKQIAEQAEQLESLGQRAAELESELRSRASVVEAQREAVAELGVAELSRDFADRAAEHARSFAWWALGLTLTVVVGGVGAVLFVYLSRPPNDANKAQLVTHATLDVLVVGLIIF